MVGENIYRNNREFKNTAVNYTGEKFIIRCGNCLETNEAVVSENKGNTLMGFKCPYCNSNYNLADITLMNNKESLIESGETTIKEHRNNVILVGYTFKQYSPSGDTIKLNEYKSTLKFECKLGKLRKSPLMDINKGGKLSTSHYGSYCPTVDWEENEYPNLSYNNFLKLGLSLLFNILTLVILSIDIATLSFIIMFFLIDKLLSFSLFICILLVYPSVVVISKSTEVFSLFEDISTNSLIVLSIFSIDLLL